MCLNYVCLCPLPKALRWHLLSLQAMQRSTTASYADLSACYSHIGLLYFEIGDMPNALDYHLRDLLVCKEEQKDLMVSEIVA